MQILTLVAALLLNVAAVPAQSKTTDLTGTWTGTFARTAPDGQTQTLNVLFNLVQKGKVLTGTVGPNPENQLTIEKGGTVDAGKISFKAVQPDGTVRTFTLKLVKDRLQGDMTAQRPTGETFTAKVDMGRAPKDK